MSLDSELREWGASTQRPAPTAAEAEALVARARGGRSWHIAWGVGAGAALVLAVWTAWVMLGVPPGVEPGAVPQTPVAVAPEPAPRLGPGDHTLDGAELRLAADSSATVLREEGATGVVLDAGAVTAVVAPRPAASPFVVATEGYRVVVVGTQFTVTRSPFEVVVVEGRVEVVGEEVWSVGAGERFADGRVHPRELLIAVKPPTLGPVRAKVLSGDLDGAREQLEGWLGRTPDDAQAWALLAQVEGKAGRVSEAVQAWRGVIAHGSPGEAQRARFEAARLPGVEPGVAEELLRGFLETPDPLAADARLRLARVLLAQGRVEEAKAEAERVVAGHPGTAPARAAAELAAGL